jgi:hypothetical protein
MDRGWRVGEVWLDLSPAYFPACPCPFLGAHMSKQKKPAFAETNVPVQNSLKSIRDLMTKYGADDWSFPETKEGDIKIKFTFRGQPVEIDLRVKKMCKRLRGYYSRMSDADLMKKAQRSVARQAYYYLKVTFEIIETGMFSEVEALLPHFVNNRGLRLADIIMDQQPNLKRMLPAAEEEDKD